MDYLEIIDTLTGIMEEYPDDSEEQYALEYAIKLVNNEMKAEDDGR